MVLDFVSILVKPAEGVYLVVPTVRHWGIDETCRTLAQSAGHLVSVRGGFLHSCVAVLAALPMRVCKA